MNTILINYTNDTLIIIYDYYEFFCILVGAKWPLHLLFSVVAFS